MKTKASQSERLFHAEKRRDSLLSAFLLFGRRVYAEEAERGEGIWERAPGNDIWRIRFRVDGLLEREQVDTHKAADELLIKRKNQISKGIKMPEGMRHTVERFKTPYDDILVLSKKLLRAFRSVEIRVRELVSGFGDKPGDHIKPAEIDGWLSRVMNTPSAPAVHSFLAHLHAAGFSAAPQVFGLHEQGRQILEYVPSSLWHDIRTHSQTDLRRVGDIIQALHRAAALSQVPVGAEWNKRCQLDKQNIVCHNDLAPWHLVFGPDPDFAKLYILCDGG